jgi:hypothetical protein
MGDQGAAIRNFAGAICSRWFVVIGVPVIAAGVYLTTGPLKTSFAIALLVPLMVAAYFEWRGGNLALTASRDRVTELEEKIRPKLNLSFCPDSADCVRPNTRVLIPVAPGQVAAAVVTVYRLRVDTDSAVAIDWCAGHLTEILRDGKSIMSGENIRLTFAPAEDSDTLAKNVYPNTSEHLEFLMISSANQLAPCAYQGRGPNSVAWRDLFTAPGEYRFRISVTSPQTTAGIDVVLNWTGDSRTLEIKEAASVR